MDLPPWTDPPAGTYIRVSDSQGKGKDWGHTIQTCSSHNTHQSRSPSAIDERIAVLRDRFAELCSKSQPEMYESFTRTRTFLKGQLTNGRLSIGVIDTIRGSAKDTDGAAHDDVDHRGRWK